MVIRRKQAHTKVIVFYWRIHQHQLTVFPLIITSKIEQISNYLIYNHPLPTPKMLHQVIPQRTYSHGGKCFL